MEWTALAMDRNRLALIRAVAALFALAGLEPGATISTLPRRVHFAVLRVLRPAESALRRVIVIAAQLNVAKGLVFALRPTRSAPTQPIPRGTGVRVPTFRLIDPRKHFEIGPRRRKKPLFAPRISFFDSTDPIREPIPEKSALSPDDPVDAARICARMLALKAALEDIPKQARRMARLEARRRAQGNLKAPMRPGKPPGHRDRVLHMMDQILSDCHGLALRALHEAAPPDTS